MEDESCTEALPVPRWTGAVFVLVGALLLPWIVLLAVRLPSHVTASHWDVAWVGLDVMEAGALGLSGYLAWRRSTWVEVSASFASALLLIDAWFDITTSTSTMDVLAAVAEAAFLELPLAAFCLWVARNAQRTNEAINGWLVERAVGGQELTALDSLLKMTWPRTSRPAVEDRSMIVAGQGAHLQG